MKFNTPLSINQRGSVDYEQQLIDFCDINRWRRSFYWNSFSCGSHVLWVEITGLKRRRNADGTFMKNTDGSFKNEKYTIYTDLKRVPPSVDFYYAKRMFSLQILKHIFNEEYLIDPLTFSNSFPSLPSQPSQPSQPQPQAVAEQFEEPQSEQKEEMEVQINMA